MTAPTNIIGELSAAATGLPVQHDHKRRRRKRINKDETSSISAILGCTNSSSDFCDESKTWRTAIEGADRATTNQKLVTSETVPAAAATVKETPCALQRRIQENQDLSMALPYLLLKREIGIFQSRKMCTNMILACGETSNNNAIFASSSSNGTFPRLMLQQFKRSGAVITREQECSLSWRPYARRRVLFSRLETSPCDAVLGISRDGSFFIAIGPCQENPLVNLALHFYGMPSPHALHSAPYCNKKSGMNRITSPRMYTIPLLTTESSSSSALFCAHEGVCEARVDILIAANIGAAFILPLENEDNEMLGKLVIFPVPNSLSECNEVIGWGLHSSEVYMNKTTSSIMTNLLWPAKTIPYFSNSTLEANAINNSSGHFDKVMTDFDGYIIFNDEADGYRVCWIKVGYSSHNRRLETISPATHSNNNRLQYGADAGIVSLPVVDMDWEHVQTARRKDGHSSTGPESHYGLQVALMAYLHIDVLLMDIIGRHSSTRRLPNFSYNIISVEGGRIVELVIGFSNSNIIIVSDNVPPPKSLGIIIRLDLVYQSYEEVGWIPSNADFKDDYSLAKWCVSLSSTINQRCPPYASCCDHYSNEAVVAMKPVRKLESPSSPIELYYG